MGSAYTTHLVNRSPRYLLLCSTVVLAGAVGNLLPLRQIAWLVVLGAGLSPILILMFLTESAFYGGLYGVAFALISRLIVHTAGSPLWDPAVIVLVSPASVFAGTFLVFSVLRRKLLKIV